MPLPNDRRPPASAIDDLPFVRPFATEGFLPHAPGADGVGDGPDGDNNAVAGRTRFGKMPTLLAAIQDREPLDRLPGWLRAREIG